MPRDAADALRQDRVRLTHMVESARRALRIAAGLTLQGLAADEVRMLAVVKSIEVIGEASTKVSEDTQRSIPAINWRGIRQIRNRLIHGYDTIDPARVWNALTVEVPPLIAELECALAAWPSDPPPAP
ncbi:MAG: HepT-like ribonuclease domain-containing protein [Phycisphaerales bacterium]